ncbi:MAG: hypothetical protein AB7O66_02885 [Limisphaerales bacterium]
MRIQKIGPGLGIAALIFGVGVFEGRSATRYRAGDRIENFTLTDRATRQPVQLSDFAGKIVFLEWFAWWCPFCQAAAPQVGTGIVDWYASRSGNPAGIPVMHVAINLQPNQESQTGNFVNRSGFDFVLEDFNRGLANRFQSGGQPIFAIINGVTNSPSHEPWELLLHQDGYGQRDFSASIADFRAAIDQVQAGPVAVAPAFERMPVGGDLVEGDELRLSAAITGTPPFEFQWFRDGDPIPGATDAEWVVETLEPADGGQYTVRVRNAAGSATSEPAVVVVRPRVIVTPRLSVLGWTAERELRVEILDAAQGIATVELSDDFVLWREWTVLPTGMSRHEVRIPATASAQGFVRVRVR